MTRLICEERNAVIIVGPIYHESDLAIVQAIFFSRVKATPLVAQAEAWYFAGKCTASCPLS